MCNDFDPMSFMQIQGHLVLSRPYLVWKIIRSLNLTQRLPETWKYVLTLSFVICKLFIRLSIKTNSQLQPHNFCKSYLPSCFQYWSCHYPFIILYACPNSVFISIPQYFYVQCSKNYIFLAGISSMSMLTVP